VCKSVCVEEVLCVENFTKDTMQTIVLYL